MKVKKYFIFIILFILFLSPNVYARNFVKIDDMSAKEAMEYGRQMERKKQEKEELNKKTQSEINRQFNELIDEENKENFFSIITIVVIILLILIIVTLSILLYKKSNNNSDKYDLS